MRIRKRIATAFLAALLVVCHTSAAPDGAFDYAALKNENLWEYRG